MTPSDPLTSSLILSVVIFIFGAATAMYWAMWSFESPRMGRLATILMLAGFAGASAGILLRWWESYALGVGRAPFTNLYESLVFFSWTIAGLYLVIERQHRFNTLGAFAAPLAFLSLAYAALQPSHISPLIPALKSNWLIAHVVTCFLGYAAFAVAFGVAVIYLIKQRDPGLAVLCGVIPGVCTAILAVSMAKARTGSFWALAGAGVFTGAGVAMAAGFAAHEIMKLIKRNDPGGQGRIISRLPSAPALDEISYQTIVFGFLFLTVGIITGAVWANSAWGRYWSWDPKETWSLITWLIYATMIHSRLIRGWRGRRTIYLALIGFSAVLFTYFGVNTLLKGLHSYAT